MRLKIAIPTKILVDEEVTKVSAEAENGSFTLLPGHIDFVAALVPSLLAYVDTAGQEQVVAVDEGILVKQGQEVLVSSRSAVKGASLEELSRTVSEHFMALGEQESQARSALARMEADVVRNLMEIEKYGGA
jgi:F-type H+-transporting ATPase subunit epsilon